jgi:hypothetical protein
METTEQILERQCTEFRFHNGKVTYFSISTQWARANTIDEAIKNILQADKKYNGKSPLRYCMEDKYSITAEKLDPIVFPDDIEKIMEEAKKVMAHPFAFL